MQNVVGRPLFYIKIVRKIVSPNFRGHMPPRPPYPTPMDTRFINSNLLAYVRPPSVDTLGSPALDAFAAPPPLPLRSFASPSVETLTQSGRSNVGSVSVQKLVMEMRMQTTETTAKTRAPRELSGSSQNSQTARCQRRRGSARTCQQENHQENKGNKPVGDFISAPIAQISLTNKP